MQQNCTDPIFSPADILLPERCDMTKWSVVACDQYTSQPEYWQRVENFVGDAPSTLRLILPESKLNDPNADFLIGEIDRTMRNYLSQGFFHTCPLSMIYVERAQSSGKLRRGLIGKVDLEQYDFNYGAVTPIRATEGTVLSRIPPRVRVRQDAALELPHIMLLVDDPQDTVFGPLRGETAEMEPLYDFELMENGGHITGRRLTPRQIRGVENALEDMTDPTPSAASLLFAVGDGNHSLATAKTCYERQKASLPEAEWENLRSRYALVELVNLYDESLEFEPIHRVVFDTDPDALLKALRGRYPGTREGEGEGHVLRYLTEKGPGALTVPEPKAQLEVGTLQTFLDEYLKSAPGRVDYIHGEDVAAELSRRPGTIAFLLPAMRKELLFPSVIRDGVLPRKTFSMGQAADKRFYLEARKIR